MTGKGSETGQARPVIQVRNVGKERQERQTRLVRLVRYGRQVRHLCKIRQVKL